MYSIRVDSRNERLLLEFSDVLTTSEALRAISQGFALAEAGQLTDVLCDLTRLVRGPANLLVVAASVASHFTDDNRIALVVGEEQVRWAQRFVRFTGISRGINAFLEVAQGEAWLSMPGRRQQALLSTTGQRHIREMTRPGGSGRASVEGQRGPRAFRRTGT